jgi:hypothetical protein
MKRSNGFLPSLAEAEVDQGKIRSLLVQFRDGVIDIDSFANLIPLPFEQSSKQLSYRGVAVEHQDLMSVFAALYGNGLSRRSRCRRVGPGAYAFCNQPRPVKPESALAATKWR